MPKSIRSSHHRACSNLTCHHRTILYLYQLLKPLACKCPSRAQCRQNVILEHYDNNSCILQLAFVENAQRRQTCNHREGGPPQAQQNASRKTYNQYFHRAVLLFKVWSFVFSGDGVPVAWPPRLGLQTSPTTSRNTLHQHLSLNSPQLDTECLRCISESLLI